MTLTSSGTGYIDFFLTAQAEVNYQREQTIDWEGLRTKPQNFTTNSKFRICNHNAQSLVQFTCS